MHLEQRLSARLLNRTSRSVSLTEVGALYLEQARAATEGLDEVEASIGSTAISPQRTLRVSAPVWMLARGSSANKPCRPYTDRAPLNTAICSI